MTHIFQLYIDTDSESDLYHKLSEMQQELDLPLATLVLGLYRHSQGDMTSIEIASNKYNHFRPSYKRS